MRIVLINNRYHVTGGPERYLFGVKTMLESRGHDVIPFAVRYARNDPTPWSHHFVPPPGGDDEVYFRDVKGLLAKARFFAKTIYSPEARRRLSRLLIEEKPDLVYVIIVANVLSPSVFRACADAGVPVVMRLSDFHLVAPCYTCFDGREACDLCLGGSRFHAVRKKCLQNSRAVSLARVAGMAVHDRLRLYDGVDRFVAPSRFLRDRMIATGIDPGRIVHVPSFVEGLEATDDGGGGEGRDEEQRAGGSEPDSRELLYVGRLDPEKGVGRLIESWSLAGEPGMLRIVGPTSTPEARRLLERTRALGLERVAFLGARDRRSVGALMQRASAVVVPSMCFENLPIVALEAMAAGRPVIAHALGSLPEVVEDGETGVLCDSGEPRSLARAIVDVLGDPERAERMGAAARRRARELYHPDLHADRLLSVFESVRGAGQERGHEETGEGKVA